MSTPSTLYTWEQLQDLASRNPSHVDPMLYFQQSQEYAATAFDTAMSLFGSLSGDVIPGDEVLIDTGDISIPGTPSIPEVGTGPVGTIAELMDAIEGIEIPVVPSFYAPPGVMTLPVDRSAPVNQAERPTLLDPDAPAVFQELAPTPGDLSPVPIPATEPSDVLPAAPSLLSFTMPIPPVIDRRMFEGTLSAAPTVTEPVFLFTEPTYISPLAQNLSDRLNTWLTGESTALDREIWAAMFSRARDREDSVYLFNVNEIRNNVSANGFRMPPGALNAALRKARQERTLKLVETSREQAIEEAKQVLEGIRISITSGVQYEGELIRRADSIAQRAFQGSVQTIDAAKWVTTTRVTLHELAIRAYEAQSKVALEWLQAELTKIEEYKSLLEAERIKSGINKDQVDVYKAGIEAVSVQWDIFIKRFEKSRMAIQQNDLRIRWEELLLKRYSEMSQTNARAWAAYSSAWQGQEIRSKIYATDITAFEAETRAFTALLGADKTKADIETVILEQYTRNYTSILDGLKTTQAGISIQLSGLVENLKSAIATGDTQAKNYATQASALVDTYKAQVERYKTDVDLAVKSAEAKITQAVETAKLIEATTIESAKVAGQLAAAALSVLHVSLSQSDSSTFSNSVGESTSTSTGESSSTSTSTVHQHIYEHGEGSVG